MPTHSPRRPTSIEPAATASTDAFAAARPAGIRRSGSCAGRWFWLLLLCSVAVNAGAPDIEVIPLSSRQASEMAAIIRPLLGAGETVVAHGSKLIVKASPPSMAEIRRLIDQLDTPLARFRISVIQSSSASLDALNARTAIHGEITDRGGAIRGAAHLDRSSAQGQEKISQTIQTVEGRAAHIEAGEAFPVAEYRVLPDGGRSYPSGVTYHQATTGFAVTPRLVGDDEVLLDIAPWADRLKPSGRGIVATRSAHTTLRARLGEWVELGGISARGSGTRSGLLQRSARDDRHNLKLFIRVDRLN